MRNTPTIPTVSIIIPIRKVNHFLLESMPYLQKIDYPNYEILIFPNHVNSKYKWPKTRIIASGDIGPAEKRDLAIHHAKGKILAFLDDDAYPTSNWLTTAVKNFADPQVAAVGGPGVTPKNASFLEAASGWVSASPIGAGPYTYRFLPGKKKQIEDYPSMNLLVKASDFKAIGGFDSHYYPGEDTKLCLDLLNLGKKIIYEPEAVVYHHRRPLWLPHLKQNGNFGIHRGFFARVLPKTSAKLIYFLPSLLVVYLVLLIANFIMFSAYLWMSLVPLIAYLFTLLVNGIWIAVISKNVYQGLLSVPAVMITHLWYGIRFIQGFLFTTQLKQ